jgi:hypothetical protein
MKRLRKKPSAVFLINDENGAMLCNDGRFRRSVLFGNVPGCLKTWRKPGFAKLAARKLGLEQWSVKYAYAGDSINHDGTVTKG